MDVGEDAASALRTLSELALALADAKTLDDVSSVVLDHGMRLARADTCVLYLLNESRTALELHAHRGVAAEVLARAGELTEATVPAVFEALRRREPVWTESQDEYARRHPALARITSDGPRARAYWSVPLVGEREPFGLLTMGFYEERTFPPEERALSEALAKQCAQALLRASARASEERARALMSTTLRSIGDAVIATDAAGRVTFMNPVAEALTGFTEAEARGAPLEEVFPIFSEETRAHCDDPVAKVLRERKVVGLANHTVLRSRSGKEIPIDDSAAPIRDAQGQLFGVVLVFRDVSERKHEEVRRAFLARAGAELTSSLDYRATLATVAELAVPQLADWCAVDLLEPGATSAQQVALAHVDPEKVRFARAIAQRYPPDPNAATGVPQVIRSGKSELYAEILPSVLEASARDDEHLRMLRELALESAMVVPLRGRERVLGAMTFIYAGSGRRYTEDDLAFAEEFARRAAMAIENARALKEAQEARALQRRLSDAELHASEERFHRLVDAVTEYAIFMLDETGHIATWNPGAQRIKDYSADEILGKHFSIFYTPEDRAAGRPERILETVRREGRFEEQNWRVRKDGSRFWADVVISALRDEGGKVTGFAKVTRDLTARREAEENARELAKEQAALAASESARRELERANQLKDEFLATMSHELRTPLNAIYGWATVLQKQQPADAQQLARGLEVIVRNAKAQTRLVSDLLDVSRIVSGKLHLTLGRTEIVPVLHAAADVVRAAAEAKGVRLVVDLDPAIGAMMADADRLQQIVWNVLSNAVRFTPRGGRVTMRAERTGSSVTITVEDTGIGIRAEHLPHIFERFRQGDSSTTRTHGGLGLGLAIVRHLVDAHGGSVEAHSEGPGRGATFTIEFPIAAVSSRPPAERTEAASEQPLETSLAGVRILVVDDDPDSRELVRVVLQRAGAVVTTAPGAREALDVIDADGPFDIIVSDIGMPETDGYTFIRRVRERHALAHVPAIALTAYARADDVERAQRAGYQRHLSKPVDHVELLLTVKKLSTPPRAKDAPP